MSADTTCQSVFLIFFAWTWLCVRESEPASLTSRLKMTSQSENGPHGALPGPISCSSNLQMTLGIPSTYDESLATWCDFFNPTERLGSQDTNHLDGGCGVEKLRACVWGRRVRLVVVEGVMMWTTFSPRESFPLKTQTCRNPVEFLSLLAFPFAPQNY